MNMIKQTHLKTAAAILVLAAGMADAADITPPGQPKDFQLPEKTEFVLENGMHVTLVPFGSVPKVSMVLRVRTGNLNEGEDTWLADLAGELMTEGAAEMDSATLARKAAELGGAISVSTGTPPQKQSRSPYFSLSRPTSMPAVVCSDGLSLEHSMDIPIATLVGGRRRVVAGEETDRRKR